MPFAVKPLSPGDALAKSAKILARQAWWHGFFYGAVSVATPIIISKFIEYELRIAAMSAEQKENND